MGAWLTNGSFSQGENDGVRPDTSTAVQPEFGCSSHWAELKALPVALWSTPLLNLVRFLLTWAFGLPLGRLQT